MSSLSRRVRCTIFVTLLLFCIAGNGLFARAAQSSSTADVGAADPSNFKNPSVAVSCADASFVYLVIHRGQQHAAAVKKVRDAAEAVREASWADQHDASLTSVAKKSALAKAESEKIQAELELQAFKKEKLEEASKQLAIACGTQIRGSSGSSAVAKIAAAVASGTTRYVWKYYSDIGSSFLIFIRKSTVSAHVFAMAGNSEAPVRRCFAIASHLLGPICMSTVLALTILLFFPALLAFHVLHDCLVVLLFRGIASPLLHEYALEHGLTSVADAAIQLASKDPAAMGFGIATILSITISLTFIALPWTMPLFAFVTFRRPKTIF